MSLIYDCISCFPRFLCVSWVVHLLCISMMSLVPIRTFVLPLYSSWTTRNITVQLNSMVYNCKDQPTIPRQDSKPGTTHHYLRNEVHTHHIQTTAIQPLQQRRQAKVLLQAETCKCLPEHPMKEKVEGRTKNRIQRSSFTLEVKRLQKDNTNTSTQ